MSNIGLFVMTIVLIVSSSVIVVAQDEDEIYVPPPKYEMSFVFDEYVADNVSIDVEKERIETYILQIKNLSKYASGYIYVYRGATDYKFNYEERINSISKIVSANLASNSMEPYQTFVRFGGFRESSTIEMIIQPPQADRRDVASTISLLDIKFLDDASVPKGTIQKTGQELLNNLTKRVEPYYPPAARAVRAIGEVGILTKIDEKGSVTEAKTFIGHPLLRTACESAVRQWQFKPEKQKAVPFKMVGIIVCEFKPTED